MSCSSTLSVSQPNTISPLTFNPTNKAISASNVITLSFLGKNPISSNSYLRIQTSLNLNYVYNQYSVFGVVPTQSSISSSELVLTNFARTTSSVFYSLTLNNFTLINPPYST